MAVITGLFISLLVTIILKFFIGNSALFLLPFLASFISVFLANEIEYVTGLTTGLLAGLISIVWIGPYFLVLGPLGAILGVFLNQYLNPGITMNPILGMKNNVPDDRLSGFNNWIGSLKLNKLVLSILTIILGLVLIWGVFAGPTLISETNHPAAPTHNNTTQQNTTPPVNSEEVSLKQNVTKGVQLFFSNFNLLFKQNGINNGYIINTIQITNITKISDNQVQVTVNLTRMTTNGGQLNSIWSGPFYLVNGTWVDKGEFIQIHSYNTTTGKDTL